MSCSGVNFEALATILWAVLTFLSHALQPSPVQISYSTQQKMYEVTETINEYSQISFSLYPPESHAHSQRAAKTFS